jgi:hypothetical protein
MVLAVSSISFHGHRHGDRVFILEPCILFHITIRMRHCMAISSHSDVAFVERTLLRIISATALSMEGFYTHGISSSSSVKSPIENSRSTNVFLRSSNFHVFFFELTSPEVSGFHSFTFPCYTNAFGSDAETKIKNDFLWLWWDEWRPKLGTSHRLGVT